MNQFLRLTFVLLLLTNCKRHRNPMAMSSVWNVSNFLIFMFLWRTTFEKCTFFLKRYQSCPLTYAIVYFYVTNHYHQQMHRLLTFILSSTTAFYMKINFKMNHFMHYWFYNKYQGLKNKYVSIYFKIYNLLKIWKFV